MGPRARNQKRYQRLVGLQALPIQQPIELAQARGTNHSKLFLYQGCDEDGIGFDCWINQLALDTAALMISR